MTNEAAYNCAVILGATATGKTALAVQLAKITAGEIISADSRQVYRGLDIGTGKDLHEYDSIPYHLIDVCDVSEEFTVFHFQQEVYRILPEIAARGCFPIVAGGTGLYLDSILRNYELIPVPENPALRKKLADKPLEELQQLLLAVKETVHNKTDLEQHSRLIRAIEIAYYLQDNPHCREIYRKNRPIFRPKVYGIFFERSLLRQRIYNRLIERITNGMIEEVENLHTAGCSWEKLDSLGLEYRFTAQYLQGKIADKETYIQTLYAAICQFAKRQETWFRRMQKNGVPIEILQGETLHTVPPAALFSSLAEHSHFAR